MTAVFVVKAALLLTDKRTWKVIGAIAAGIVLLIAMPVVILIGVFENLGQMDFTDSSLKQQVLEGLTSEDRAGLEAWQSTSTTLEAAMEEAGYGDRTAEALALYAGWLYPLAGEEGFVERLVGCFEEGQSIDDLLAHVKEAFGIEISAEAFEKAVRKRGTDHEKRNGLAFILRYEETAGAPVLPAAERDERGGGDRRPSGRYLRHAGAGEREGVPPAYGRRKAGDSAQTAGQKAGPGAKNHRAKTGTLTGGQA